MAALSFVVRPTAALFWVVPVAHRLNGARKKGIRYAPACEKKYIDFSIKNCINFCPKVCPSQKFYYFFPIVANQFCQSVLFTV